MFFSEVMLDYKISIFAVSFCVLEIYLFQSVYCDCQLFEISENPNKKKQEEELLKTIQPLKGLEFSATDQDGNEKYLYKIRICDKIKDANVNVGAMQYGTKNYSLGLYTMADITNGTDWLMLSYYNGDPHGSTHCNATGRISRIMIICDPDHVQGEFRILEEKLRLKSELCFYLFELSSSVACTKKTEQHGLSSGGVFCVLFFTFVGTYFILGFLYQRLVAGAKGLEQIPHYSFWRAFGNLQADGCDFICRCGPRHESQAYRGIDDRLKEDERDDQLLNM